MPCYNSLEDVLHLCTHVVTRIAIGGSKQLTVHNDKYQLPDININIS